MQSRGPVAWLVAVVMLMFLVAPSSAEEASPPADIGAKMPLKRAMSEFPRVGKYEVLCGDFHIHTIHSDGQPTPADRILEAWRYGYDVVAITDHGNYKAYAEALPLARSLGVLLIRGLETGLAGAEHLVALGIPADYEPLKPHAWDAESGKGGVYYRDELTKLSKAGACVIYAHPHVGFREPVVWGVEQGMIQGIEVRNKLVGSGLGQVASHGTWCYPNAFSWALEHGLAVFANSDAHGSRDLDVAGRVVTLVFAKERTDKGVLDAIRNRRTIAWFDGMLWGSESLLKDLVMSTVKVHQSVGSDGNTWVTIENHGPVSLKASMQTSALSDEPISLCPYESVLVKRSRPQDYLSIRWPSIWTAPNTNLVTTHDIRPTGMKAK